VVLAVLAGAGVAYLLLDVFFLLFLGIVVAAALQPWHLVLCRWGIAKGPAVLMIYLLLLVVLMAVGVIVGPVVFDQFSAFVESFPSDYTLARTSLSASTNAPLHAIGQTLPPFASLSQALSGFRPRLYEGTFDLTASILKLPAMFVTVLAIAFYWTIEMPQIERLMATLLDVERRPQALQVWHDIEARLGGFLRGQGLAMLFVGTASAIGYAQIGLPNVMALGILAGLLELVPWIGPLLAVFPAVLVALPLGTSSVALVLALAAFLQVIESNVLVPRIMARTVGISPLVSLLAILAFGTLYGIAGVLLAIPLAAALQVLMDTFVVNVTPPAPNGERRGQPLEHLKARYDRLRRQARSRLRARTGRMDPDSATSESGDDAADQGIEVAVRRAEAGITAARQDEDATRGSEHDDLVLRLRGAAERFEEAELGDPGKAGSGDGLAEASEQFSKDVEAALEKSPIDD
jgi:predicted PurR-regulated permease PerM